MKKHYFFLLLVRAGSLSGLVSLTHNASMVLNSNAQRGIKLVSDFVNELTDTDEQASVRMLLSSGYVAHGPSQAGSAAIDQTMKGP